MSVDGQNLNFTFGTSSLFEVNRELSGLESVPRLLLSEQSQNEPEVRRVPQEEYVILQP